MFIAILTLLSALSISGVAIFYSVIGLATIFPGAFWPVVIMGSVLEVGKLVTASWLYRNWKQTRFLLKTYLTIAVIVLSLITSMGIFGFLSKAHLEQNLAEDTVTQRIEIINSKITSEETYIKRQLAVIERAEKTLDRTGVSNKDAIEIEKQNLKDAQDKLKTLLVVETNTIKDLNNRLSILDNDVKAYTDRNKGFGGSGRVKKGIALREAQEPERNAINGKIDLAQSRIQSLKDDYKNETDLIQKRISNLRDGGIDDKSDVNAQITVAEENILKAQNNIDDLIIEREPLQSQMIKLEAEVGPVKYIAALVVDWGVTTDVDTSEAVRWVILIIICVFDPLAVLLLVAANQSLLRRFPVQPLPPEKIIDLEKPDADEDIVLRWKDQMAKNAEKTNNTAQMEQATAQLQDWKDKLSAFNNKIERTDQKTVEIIQEQDDTIPHIDLKGQKKTEDKEIAVDNIDGFDPDEVALDMETKTKSEIKAEKEAQEEEFKKREEEERKALEDYAVKAKEDDGFDVDEIKFDLFEEPTEEPSVSELLQEGMKEQIEAEEKEERIKPDLTEVVEPEVAVKEPETTTVEEALKMPTAESVETPIEQPAVKATTGLLGTRVVNKKGKVVEPPKPEIPSNWQRRELLDKFHKEHGNFEDVSDEYIQNEEQDDNTLWQKTKQETIDVENPIVKEKFTKYKKRITTDTDYHSRMEQRISDLITNLENGEIAFKDLTKEDQQVIIEVLNQNE